MVDAADDVRAKLAARRRDRLTEDRFALPISISELYRELRQILLSSHDVDLLITPPQDIWHLLRREQEKAPGTGGVIAVGVRKDFKRVHPESWLVRGDGARIKFSITVHQETAGIVLKAYDFEIHFPDGMAPEFLRYDLNLPDHPNDAHGMRSHLHPGSDDMMLPALVYDPRELLTMLLYEIERPVKPRHTSNP